jgi:transcriptional regulator with XRE-family HTH domain
MKTKKDYREFSKRFNEAMADTGFDELTREQVGRKFGVTGPAVSYWSTGQRIPTPRQAAIVAKKLKVSVEWLLTGKEANTPAINSNGLTDDQLAIIESLIKSFKHKERRKSVSSDRRKIK